MTAPAAILELVARYRDNRDEYRSAAYKEFRLRKEFIDPFFEALGWDVSNKSGYAEAYKDVVHEDSIKIAKSTKAPDYAFRVGGTRKFFVEAKAPLVNIKEDISPAYQLRRYGWSSKLPISILTDFEEFAVYDCRIQPKPKDTARKARLLYCTYEDYESQWDAVADIFSREAILKGSFDRYAVKQSGRRGTDAVDDAFLSDIESWRALLASEIHAKNPNVDVDELNYAVQKTIDRIVFLRIAEDRGFETYNALGGVAQSNGVYDRLGRLFRAADRRYNSGLFHFSKNSDHSEQPDTFTLDLKIGDAALKKILSSLYFPESPYEFSVLPADILGQIYEQFLGKVIRLDKGSALVEEKPEVKKAGGVYYTPTYIVRYIVNRALGGALEGKTPAQASGDDSRVKNAHPVRVLDPACGSGSFLIGAYQYLLDWYLARYLEEGASKYAKGKNPRLYETETGEWRLSIAEKRRILLTHIYGVDIDSQAVEVTKLSLLMKVLEGESGDALASQMNLFQMQALPDVGSNIRSGNSIIDTNSFSNAFGSADEETFAAVNPFDWHDEFQFLKSSKFDVVIGNPPYLSIDSVWGAGDRRLAAIRAGFPKVYADKTDIYYYFFARAVEITEGAVSFICSRAFLESYKATNLRGTLSQMTAAREIIDFRNFIVFKGVGITTAIILLDVPKKRKPGAQVQVYKCTDGTVPVDVAGALDPNAMKHIAYPQKLLGSAPWSFDPPGLRSIFALMDGAGEELGEVLELGQGMQTGANSVFGGFSASDLDSMGAPNSLRRKRASNTDIQRYRINDRGEYLLYLEGIAKFSDLPAGVQRHLNANKNKLKSRAAYERGNCEWWKYTWPLKSSLYNRNRILVPYLASSNRFAIAKKIELGLTDTTVIFDNGQKEDIRYFLALLNSSVIQARYIAMAKLKSSGIYEYFWNSLSRLRVKRIDFNNKAERSAHDSLVKLSRDAEVAIGSLEAAKIEAHARAASKRVNAILREIDQLVAQLYGLNATQVEALTFVDLA
jgi:hypothetical protein